MRNFLIGKILKILNLAYEEGACDNLSKEETELVVNSLSTLYSNLSHKKDETFTTELASIYLNVTRQTINNYVKVGKLHPTRLLGGVLQYSKKELDCLIIKK